MPPREWCRASRTPTNKALRHMKGFFMCTPSWHPFEFFFAALRFGPAAAAAAAKSLQSCLTLCDPIDGSPPGSSIHGIFQARVLEWGAIAFSTDLALGTVY